MYSQGTDTRISRREKIGSIWVRSSVSRAVGSKPDASMVQIHSNPPNYVVWSNVKTCVDDIHDG